MYEKYEDEFIDAINKRFELDEEAEILYQIQDFSLSSFKAPQLGISFVDKLLKLN